MKASSLSIAWVILAVTVTSLSGCGDDAAAESTESGADDDDDSDDDADDSDENADDDDDDDTVTVDGPDGGSFEVVFGGEGVECGDETCLDAQFGEFTVPGCCAGEAGDTCGLDLALLGVLIGLVNPSCEPLNAPGSEDENCPESPPLAMALTAEGDEGTVLPGCCQASGQCGYFASLQGIGFGCVSPTRFGNDEGEACDFQP